MKVVRMLQDMRVGLQSDLEDDKEVHEKLDCWCKENDREKTQAIQQGEAREAELEALLGETAAKMEEIKTKRNAAKDEADRDWEALKTATALRMKENQAFHGEETHLLEAKQAADQAIVVLRQHHPGLTQLRAVAQQLRKARVLPSEAGARASPRAEELRALLDGAEAAGSFLAIPGYRSYSPQSGQILGVLQQMKEDFARDLADARQQEDKAAEEFKALEKAKQEEIDTGRRLVVQLDQAYAAFGEKKQQAFDELQATKRQLGLDRTFLGSLKKRCSETDAEFEERMKSRMEEIRAVDETIKILNEDKAFDVFDRTLVAGPTEFLQTSSNTAEHLLRERAAAALLAAARSGPSPRLLLLASRVKLDTFTKVKQEIDKMVAALGKQQQDEVEHRDWCIKELAENNRSQAAAYDQKEDLEAKIADLTQTIETLSKQIDEATARIAETQEQMKRASETREAENADFQQTIQDQRLTQTVLRKALQRMGQVYASLLQAAAGAPGGEEEQQPGAAHIALSGNHTNAGNGPVRFTKYAQNAGGSKVIQAIELIIADARAAEDRARASEQDGQMAYEDLMKESNELIVSLSGKISTMSGSRATAKEDLSMAKSDLKDTVTELAGLHQAEGDLHKSCDYILDNFSARQAARAAEMVALKDAKAILSGALLES